MEVKAITKFIRISPEKAIKVARILPGKPVDRALAELALSPRKAARHFDKTLRSAIANAEHNLEMDRDDLFVKEAFVGPGPIMKRFRPRARGMAGRIRKRTSHFTVIVSD